MAVRYFMTDGTTDLDVMVSENADLDGTFTAICNDTGETLRVNGWLIADLERIEERKDDGSM